MEKLVDGLIQAIAAQVVTTAAKEVQFALDYRTQFKEMKKGLERMKALLGDTENVKSSYQSIAVTLGELREVIYEADNALIDCLLRDDETDKYSKQNTCSCRFFYLSLLGDPCFSHQMGKKLTKINSEMNRIEATLGGYLSKSPSQHLNDNQELECQSQDSEPGMTYGLEDDTRMLTSWILGSSLSKDVERIGIVGMGGLGKTTIAQKLFNDPALICYFDKIMWACASRNFSPYRILKRLLGRAGYPVKKSQVNCMLSTLKGVLKDKSYLIVIDDVWPNFDSWWSDLCSNLPKTDGKPSCVIITSRFEDVARRMVTDIDTRIHKPKHLNDEHSWSLFSESVSFQRYEGLSQKDDLMAVGTHILNKCGGLPMAIKAVGRLLASKQNNDSLAVWEDTEKRFHKIMTTEQDTETETEVMVSLQFSYDELPTRLKHCLLCLSIYPEDFEIQAQQIIHWWIAEGLVQAEDSKTAIELGYDYLAKLVNRCLVEVVDQRGYDGRIDKCKIHDMVRELITKIADKEAFCSFNEQGLQRQRHGYRWLCFTGDMAPADNEEDQGMQKLFMVQTNRNLRALFLMSSPQIGFGGNFESMQSIRLLDLSYSKLDDQTIGFSAANAKESDGSSNTTIQPVISVEELFRCIAFLKRLACLNLSGVQKVHHVPPSIRKLCNLRIFVLSGCSNLKQIHSSITELKRLIVLDLGACPSLQYLPQGLGSLCHLQELIGFRVVRNSGLVVVQNLSQLRVLHIVISNSASVDEMKGLSSLIKLQVLDIDAKEGTEQICEVLGSLDLPPNLLELYLRNYNSEQMPKWFHPNKLSRLQYLCIENCHIISLPDRIGWKIEGLCMKLLIFLAVDWGKLKMSMARLRYMEISSCPNLKNFPCSVEELGVWRNKAGKFMSSNR